MLNICLISMRIIICNVDIIISSPRNCYLSSYLTFLYHKYFVRFQILNIKIFILHYGFGIHILH